MNKMIQEQIVAALVALEVDISDISFTVEHPSDLSHGDFATNVALVAAKKIGTNPREFAEKLAIELYKNKPEEIAEIDIAGPGFVNFHLSPQFFIAKTKEILNKQQAFGRTNLLKGQKTLYEYTDVNVFKEFHIGHLMPNTIGETLSRIGEWNGAEVKRCTYFSDLGLNIACSIWGMQQNRLNLPTEETALKEKVHFLGQSYALGATEYKRDVEIKAEIDEINKKLFQGADRTLQETYEQGRQWSLDFFETLYKKLGTKFDFYFPESNTIPNARELIHEGLEKGVFEKSDGAIIFRGEDIGLHTRVFVNKFDLPTYEGKEVANARVKAGVYAYDKSFIISSDEIDAYFDVVFAAMEKLLPEFRAKTEFISHGTLKLTTGKMSSRTGKVIPADDFIADLKKTTLEKMSDRDLTEEEKGQAAEVVAVGAIKYTILKQAIGKDVIFDPEKSLSFEGDSGPYIQYTYTRARSILQKAQKEGVATFSIDEHVHDEWVISNLEKLTYRFPEVIERAYTEKAPQLIVGYVTELASAFNSFYAREQIVDTEDTTSPYKIALTEVVAIILKSGLQVLGIKVPEKM